MGIFDKVTDTLATAGKGGLQKANDLSGMAKLKLSINETEKSFNEECRSLGQHFFEIDPNGVKEFFPDRYWALVELSEKLSKEKKEMAILKGMRICPNCGSEQDGNSLRCTVCGMEASQASHFQEEVQFSPVAKCSSCGYPLDDGAKFCMHCGTPIQ